MKLPSLAYYFPPLWGSLTWRILSVFHLMFQITHIFSSENAIRLKSPSIVLHLCSPDIRFTPHTPSTQWCERRARMSTGERKPLWCRKKKYFDKPNLIWRLTRSSLMAVGRRETSPACSSLALTHSHLCHFHKLRRIENFKNVSRRYSWPSAERATHFSSGRLLQKEKNKTKNKHAQHQPALGTVNEGSAPVARSITLTWHGC